RDLDPARRPYLGGGFLQCLPPACNDGHVDAFLRKREGAGPPQTSARARQQRLASADPEIHSGVQIAYPRACPGRPSFLRSSSFRGAAKRRARNPQSKAVVIDSGLPRSRSGPGMTAEEPTRITATPRCAAPRHLRIVGSIRQCRTPWRKAVPFVLTRRRRKSARAYSHSACRGRAPARCECPWRAPRPRDWSAACADRRPEAPAPSSAILPPPD